VHANIAAFGGDPSRVVLVGESAGGASVYNHLVRPKSWGLFSRAVAESGAYTLILPQPEPEEFEHYFSQVLNASGCADVDCLQRLDADRLLAISESLNVDLEPAVDQIDLKKQIKDLLQKGQVVPNVPFIAGATREDLGYPLWTAPNVQIACSPSNCTFDDFVGFVEQLSGVFHWNERQRARAIEAYRGETALAGGNYTKWYWAARHMGSDHAMICPARRSVFQVGTAQSFKASTYMYLFAHAPDGPSGVYPNLAHHASEIPFVFHDMSAHGPNAAKYHISLRELPLSNCIARAWSTFAKTGTPPALWPAYSINQSWMVFEDSGGVSRQQFKREQCDFWDDVLATSVRWGTAERKAARKALRGNP